MNGIWLPDPSESDAIGLIHSGRHPNIYAEAVNERIMALDVSKSDYENSQKKIINEINNIKEKLYNAQKDGKTWYDVL